MGNPEDSLFARVGEEGFERLVAAFYRQIPGDDILGPMYRAAEPGDTRPESTRMAAAEARLRDFLIFRFGGPSRYIEQRGHPALRKRHFPFVVNQAARDRWVQLMDHALDQAALGDDVTAVMREFLGNVATFLINSPEAH
ncbi:MAG: globin [Acidobacteriota bacterium]|nr:globin [Acidobacteriota bacterium]